MCLQNTFKSTILVPSAFVVMILSLGSCKVLQPYSSPDIISKDTLFRDIPEGDTVTIANIPWKDFFPDQHLVSLINEALANNTDMQIAEARIKSAKALLQQSRAGFFPSLSISGKGTVQQTGNSAVSEEYQLTGTSSWEVDVWGKLRNTKRSYLDLFLKSEAYKRAVQTQLISDVASAYYTLLALDAKLQVTEKTAEFRNTNVETLKIMKESDLITGADLVQGQASLYSAKISIPEIKQSIFETENALSILIGRGPGYIDRGELSDQETDIEMKAGIPAQLLANRPDVQEAEYQLRYGYEITNAARKYFYPALTISATGGYMANDISQLFDPSSLFWNLIGGLTQPVFNNGLNKQRLKSALADQEEYLAEYKQVLLNSGQEVSDAMHSYQTATEMAALREKQVMYLEKAVDYTMELLKYSSSTTYTDVLVAEVNLLSARLNRINDKLQQLQSSVSLYRSLGGGWKE